MTTRRPSAIPYAARWDAALADCADTLTRARLAVSTMTRVAKHVRRFASDVGTPPYDVTAGQVAAWLEALTCGDSARYVYATSLRTFYRWAKRAGRMSLDPTASEGPHKLAKPVPEPWEDALRDFRRWMGAARYSHETAAHYTQRLRSLARETGAPTPWTLSADDLTDWLSGHRWARETLRGARTVLRTFYGWAHEAGRIDDNPAGALPIVRPSAPRPRPATEDAYTAALREADDRTALMLRLAAELGLRRAEVAQVHALDITADADGQSWLDVRGKGDKPRRLPLTRELAAALRSFCTSGYVFPGNYDGHLAPRTVGKLVSALLPAGVTMHALRHRFATRAYNVDRDVFTVQQLLGHASAATTQRYVETSTAAMRRLVVEVAR